MNGPRVFFPPLPDAPHGAWYWDNPRRSLVIAMRYDGPILTSALTNLVMVSAYISVTQAQFWSAKTAAFVSYVAFSLGIPSSSIVIAGTAPPVQTRRRLFGAPVGSIDFAWLAPGASNATLMDMQSALEQVLRSNPTFGGATVQSFTTVISAPLCDALASECNCPFPHENATELCAEPIVPAPAQEPEEPDPTPYIIAFSILGCIIGLLVAVIFERCRAASRARYEAKKDENKFLPSDDVLFLPSKPATKVRVPWGQKKAAAAFVPDSTSKAASKATSTSTGATEAATPAARPSSAASGAGEAKGVHPVFGT